MSNEISINQNYPTLVPDDKIYSSKKLAKIIGIHAKTLLKIADYLNKQF